LVHRQTQQIEQHSPTMISTDLHHDANMPS